MGYRVVVYPIWGLASTIKPQFILKFNAFLLKKPVAQYLKTIYKTKQKSV